jgi:large repetitive protein
MHSISPSIFGKIAAVRSALVLLSSVLVLAACEDADPTAPVTPVTIETATLASAIEGQGYTQTLAAAGGGGSYSWILTAGHPSLGPHALARGVISGTPVGAGTAAFRVRATDMSGRSATANLSLPVIQALAVHTWTLPEAAVGTTYAAQLQAVGGSGARTWSLAGEAAAWLTVSATGALSGTPTVPGASTVTVGLADAAGQLATRQFTIVVRAPVAVAAMALPQATQGRPWAAQLVATGGDGAYAWSLDSGALPAGVVLAAGGALAGTPTEGGAFTFTAKVTDGAGRSASRELELTVDRAPTIETTSLPAGDVGTPFAAQLAATGGSGAYTWSLAEGTLPAGLTLSAGGALSGVPTTLGSSTFTVRVTDAAGAAHTRAFTMVVAQIVTLTSGVAVTDIGGAVGSARYYAIEVPAGATQLTVATSGGTGDVDLYLRRGGLPQEFVYDCRPFREGNAETCSRLAPDAGTWYIMLRGHTAYAGVRLEATVGG